MNQELAWVLKTLILPPGGLVLLGLLGLMLGQRLLGRLLLFLTLTLLYLLSTPFLAGQLTLGLESIHPPLSREALRKNQAQAIVLLGGGRYFDAPEYGGDTINGPMLERARYAAWLHHRTGLPVISSGGSPKETGVSEAELARRVLQQEFGAKVLAVEERSRTTWDNAFMTGELLKREGIERVLLVTHAWHMPRALEIFWQAGVDAVPAPTAYAHTQRRGKLSEDLLPSAVALNDSTQALHEYLGLLWYRLRGFIQNHYPPDETHR